MMSFYFIDDDKNICNILKLIINERGLGVCCGSANNAAEALEDLPSAKPDIVIVDLLMPEMDGISFVKQARKIVPDASYIMLSQVSSKDRSCHQKSFRWLIYETNGPQNAKHFYGRYQPCNCDCT